jgi:radical SAM protein with 4Fe4S-binding SPASM domain
LRHIMEDIYAAPIQIILSNRQVPGTPVQPAGFWGRIKSFGAGVALATLRDKQVLRYSSLQKWSDYSPFHNSVCRSCEFLSTCLGGCPRNQMESRTVQVKENCTYHMKYEKQVLLFHLGHRKGIEMISAGDAVRTRLSPFIIL